MFIKLAQKAAQGLQSVEWTSAYLPRTFTLGTLCSPHNSCTRVKLVSFVFILQDGDHATRYRLWNSRRLWLIVWHRFGQHCLFFPDRGSVSETVIDSVSSVLGLLQNTLRLCLMDSSEPVYQPLFVILNIKYLLGQGLVFLCLTFGFDSEVEQCNKWKTKQLHDRWQNMLYCSWHGSPFHFYTDDTLTVICEKGQCCCYRTMVARMCITIFDLFFQLLWL